MPNIIVLLRRGAPVLLLFAATASCSGTASLESSKAKSQANPIDADEQALLTALDAYRSSNGVGTLAGCASLNVSASSHADDMRDSAYLSDVGLDGSTVRTRSCSSGYESGCADSSAMGELVSSGLDDPNAILAQWTGDSKTRGIVLSANLTVAGVAESFGSAPPVWSVDLGGVNEASCTP